MFTVFLFVYLNLDLQVYDPVSIPNQSFLILWFQFYLILVIPSFLGVNHVLTQPMLCKIEALAIQFFYLSAMCWLSSMAYDIWSTFRQLRTRPHDNQGRGWRHPRYKWWVILFLTIFKCQSVKDQVKKLSKFLSFPAVHFIITSTVKAA